MLLLPALLSAQSPVVPELPVPASPASLSIPAKAIASPETPVKQPRVQDSDDPMKSKTFSKTFAFDGNDKVSIVNQYGSITLKTWDRNEVKIDADIKAYALTNDAAQELLDAVSIEALKNGDLASFKTIIQQNKGWNNWGRGSKNGVKWRREVKIYITLYMPAKNALTASQTYGNITMDDFSGPTSLKVQYGNLSAGNLNHSNNRISVQYGKAALKNVNAAEISHQYGDGLTLVSINDLTLEAQYTTVQIGTIKGSANIKHQYGKGVNIDYAGTLSLTAQYTNVKLKKLGGTFTGSLQYSRLGIENIDGASKIVNIRGGYSHITLGFNTNYGGVFNVATNYSGFKYGSRVSAEQQKGQRPGSTSKAYSGQIGNGGQAQVNVHADYGSVTFN